MDATFLLLLSSLAGIRASSARDLSVESSPCTFISQEFIDPYSPCAFIPNECQCCIQQGKYLLYCGKVLDWDNLTEMMRIHFRNVRINKLYLHSCNITEFHHGEFSGLTVEQFILDKSSVENVDKEAFLGVRDMTTLSWTSVGNTTSIPDVPNDLMIFQFVNNDLESVETQLQNMTSLTDLDLSNNQINYIHPDAFMNCCQLESVDLSNNQISQLSMNLFQNMNQLRILSISGNQLTSVERLIRFSASSLEYLRLDGNAITSISDAIDVPFRKLSKFFIQDNPLTILNTSHIDGKFENLKTLKLTNTSLSQIERYSFDSLENLQCLVLSNNNLTDLPGDLFARTVSLVELRLDGNNLRNISELFQNTTTLTSLFLSNNQIKDFGGAFDNLSSLKQLFLQGNLIETIPSNAFAKNPKLEILDLYTNRIQRLNKDSFMGLQWSLHILDLTSNRLQTLGDAFCNENTLQSLQYLHLNFNELSFLSYNDLKLRNLSGLYIRNNMVSTLDNAFVNLKKLEVIHLSGNNLTIILQENFLDVSKLRDIRLEDNPLTCDCRIEWLVNWYSTPGFLFDDPICVQPEWVKGQLVRELSETSISQWTENCPEECVSCSCFINGNSISINVSCSGRGLQRFPSVFPPETIFLNISFNQLTIIPENLSQYVPNLQYLDLRHNQLQTLEHLQMLRQIDISENKLKRFPNYFLYNMNLTEARISENPWTCDCNAEPFRTWILKNFRIIPDVNQTYCSTDDSTPDNLRGKVLASLQESDLCPLHISVYFIIAIGVLAFLLSVLGGFVGYIRYQMPIKVWLYSRGLCLRWVKENDLDDDKDFDAFVAFSTEEQHCVDQLLEELEHEPPFFKLCVHYRDFIGGELILENIARAVISSKRILILLSRSFLDNQWTMTEFREAHAQTMNEKRNRIIFILVGKLPPDDEIPNDVKTYLQSVTYLRWEEKYFWEKLRYALPRNPVTRRPMNPELEPLL